eukprot:3593802-Prymnesium_polylepis.1
MPHHLEEGEHHPLGGAVHEVGRREGVREAEEVAPARDGVEDGDEDAEVERPSEDEQHVHPIDQVEQRAHPAE